MYYRDFTLSQEFNKQLIEVKGCVEKIDKKKYEDEAIKIRDRFNEIIFFYHNDFKSYLERSGANY
jgi:hypothetical protein